MGTRANLPNMYFMASAETNSSTILVCTQPGLTEFTRTLNGASSVAAALVRPTTPALAAV